MDPAALVKLAIISGIVLLVLSIGLSAPPGSIRAGFGRPAAVGRAMVAMYMLFPLVAIALAVLLPLEPYARTALLALAVSPIVPVLPLKEQKAGASADYALALQVAAAVVALAAAPAMALLAGALTGREVEVDGMGMVRITLLTVVVPLLAGIGIAAVAPALAPRLVRPVQIAGAVLVGGVLLLLLPRLAPLLLSVASFPTLAAIVLLTAAGMAIGHAMAGPPIGQQRGLALATAARHPGVAIVLGIAATQGDTQKLMGVVLLYLILSSLLAIPYLKRTQALVA
jgi:BASS family bile acid:Na+ symporter